MYLWKRQQGKQQAGAGAEATEIICLPAQIVGKCRQINLQLTNSKSDRGKGEREKGESERDITVDDVMASLSTYVLRGMAAGVHTTYLLAAVEIHQEYRAAFTFKKFPRLRHDFGNKTLEIVLFLEDAACQIQKNLIAPIFLDGHFKELRVLYTDAAKS